MSYIRICQNTTDTHSTVQLSQTLTKTSEFQNRTYCYVQLQREVLEQRLFCFHVYCHSSLSDLFCYSSYSFIVYVVHLLVKSIVSVRPIIIYL